MHPPIRRLVTALSTITLDGVNSLPFPILEICVSSSSKLTFETMQTGLLAYCSKKTKTIYNSCKILAYNKPFSDISSTSISTHSSDSSG